MTSRAWLTQAEGAPHGKPFYIFVSLLGLLGIGCSIALSQNEALALGWRIGFAIEGFLFLIGVGQAVERLGWPGQAMARTASLTETAQLQILLARWATLLVSLGGCGVVSAVWIFGNAATQDVCDNLRILFFFLLYLCFCLADLAGEQTFPQSMWSSGWRASADDARGLAKTRKNFY